MFWRDESGHVAIIMVAGATFLTAGAGFGVEVGLWRYQHVRLQQAADAAAYAAALELRARTGTAAMTSAATAVAKDNHFDPTKGSIAVVTPSPQAAADPTTVRAVLTRSEPPIFVAMFRSEPTLIQASASARYTPAANACVLALDRTAARAVEFSGSSSLTLTGCVVAANSSASDAIRAQGASTVSAPCMYSAGGAYLSSNVTLTACTGVRTDEPLTPDPYKDYVIPSTGGELVYSQKNRTTYEHGRYPNGISPAGDAHFKPGVYFIEGGEFSAKAGARLTGDGVTFVFLNNTAPDLHSQPDLQLSAPTTGPNAGLLFVGARTNSTNSAKINGGGTSRLTGALYFPGQQVQYAGNFSGANGCVQVVAKTVSWTGNTSMSVNCSAFGIAKIEVGGAARLIR